MKYTINEIHGEAGRTTDGRKLYWAKVSEDIKPQYPHKDCMSKREVIKYKLVKDIISEKDVSLYKDIVIKEIILPKGTIIELEKLTK